MQITGKFDTNRWRVEEAQQALLAIRQGAVDAFVVEEPDGDRVYALAQADLPYSVLVNQMMQGAAMLNAHCEIVYCNPSLVDLLGVSRSAAIGSPLQEFLAESDRRACQDLFQQARFGPAESEFQLRRADGTLVPVNLSFLTLSADHSTIGVLVTDLRAQKSNAEFTARLQEMQDEERRRIARELHDSVGQLLAAVTMNIQRVKQESYKLSPEVAKVVEDNRILVDQVTKEIRTISHLLHPPLLDVAGLASALRWYVDGFSDRSNIKVSLDIPDEFPRLPGDVEIAVFRMVQECLSNVRRHSGSESCAVKVERHAEILRLEIKDQGRGIPNLNEATFTAGVGLRGMQERIERLKGSLHIDTDEHGTTVTATVPFSPLGVVDSPVASRP